MDTKVSERIRTYDGLEFSITSSFNFEDVNGNKIESVPLAHETLRLHFPQKGPAWKYWVQKIQDKFDDEWIINRFHVTNITETRFWIYEPESEGHWSQGSVFPWYIWDDQDGRCFSSFLSMNTSSISLLSFEIPDTLQKQFTEKKIPVTEGPLIDGIKTLAIPYHNAEMETDSVLHITEPYYLVVHSEVKGIKEKFSIVYHVDQIGFFEGICYPKKGYYYLTAIGVFGKEDYKFEVTDVRRFDPQLINQWFPEWPSATIVSNANSDKAIRIPPSERQLQKVAKQYEELTSSRWMPFRIVLIVSGVLLILISFYLKARKWYLQKHR
jgi:hypothetical protein